MMRKSKTSTLFFLTIGVIFMTCLVISVSTAKSIKTRSEKSQRLHELVASVKQRINLLKRHVTRENPRSKRVTTWATFRTDLQNFIKPYSAAGSTNDALWGSLMSFLDNQWNSVSNPSSNVTSFSNLFYYDSGPLQVADPTLIWKFCTENEQYRDLCRATNLIEYYAPQNCHPTAYNQFCANPTTTNAGSIPWCSRKYCFGVKDSSARGCKIAFGSNKGKKGTCRGDPYYVTNNIASPSFFNPSSSSWQDSWYTIWTTYHNSTNPNDLDWTRMMSILSFQWDQTNDPFAQIWYNEKGSLQVGLGFQAWNICRSAQAYTNLGDLCVATYQMMLYSPQDCHSDSFYQFCEYYSGPSEDELPLCTRKYCFSVKNQGSKICKISYGENKGSVGICHDQIWYSSQPIIREIQSPTFWDPERLDPKGAPIYACASSCGPPTWDSMSKICFNENGHTITCSYYSQYGSSFPGVNFDV